MTRVKAQAKWVRIAPRKLSLVAKLVRGKPAAEALSLLKLMPQKGARIMEKVLGSAVANAKNNYKLNADKLMVAQAFVNRGFALKRWNARARGRAGAIAKPTSHVTVLLEETKEAA